MVDKNWSDHLLAGFLRLLGQQNSLDVGQNTTLSDCDARQQLVQLLVVADDQPKVSLLIVTSSVSSYLENLGRQILHDSGTNSRLCAADDECDRPGTGYQHDLIGFSPFPSPCRPFRV